MNRPTTRILRLALFGASLALPGTINAQVSISTAVGDGADTFLTNDGNSGPTATKGTAGSVELRNWSTVRMRLILLRFDISGLDPASNNLGATLSLAQSWGANRSRDWLVYGLRDGYDNSGVDANLTENWSEAGTSYNTTPGILGPGAADATYAIDIYDAGTNPTGAWELLHTEPTWGIGGVGGGATTMPTADLQSFIDADTDGVVSFLLVTTGAGDSSQYYGVVSKDDGSANASDYPRLVLPNGTAGDSDFDGLADDWEIAHFGDLSQSGTDDSDTDDGLITGNSDPDGFDNEAEETAGSDPLNPLSTPDDTDADGLTDAWEIANFGDILQQDGSGDPDADWGSNLAEEAAGTDPNDRASFLDDDGGSPDGQNDWWEVVYFGDTSTSTSGSDNIDADAHDNDAEYAAYSNPNDPLSIPGDIDGDGVPDLWEDQYYGNNDGIIVDTDADTDLLGTDGTLDNEPDGFTDLEESTAVVPSNPFDDTSVPDNADGDSLSDAWELSYFPDIYGQTGLVDSDGDLYTNEEEETDGTSDPTDIFSFVEDVDMDDQNDRWELLYFGSLTESEDQYLDPDLDTWDNIDEYELGSNPNNTASTPDDIDGDGLFDSDEIAFWGDIYTHDGDDDPDRDYSTNLEEQDALTDPTNRASSPDSDFDGLGDGWEMFSFGDLTTTDLTSDDNDNDTHDNAAEYAAASNGNDPLSTPDTDADGLPDGWEINYFILGGEDPVADAATIIARQSGQDDSDGGGASNQLELYAGTNPNDMGVDDPNPAALTTADGNGADTFLTNDGNTGPEVVHGANGGLVVRTFSGVRMRLAMIRFDVSNLEGDLSNTLLQLNNTGAPRTRDLTVYGLVDGDPDEAWDETTTNYLNAPGLVAADVEQLGQFARDPQKWRRIGIFHINQNVVGTYLSDPNTLSLQSFIEDDTDGLITLLIEAPDDNHEFYFSTKEGGVAPTLIVPNGTITVPADIKIASVTMDTGTNTFTMSVNGLAIGSQYHLEALTPPSTSFTAIAGSTFTASSDPEDVAVTADESVNPTQLFRIVDGPEPAP